MKPAQGNGREVLIIAAGAAGQRKWKFLKDQPSNCLSEEGAIAKAKREARQ